MVKLQQNVLKYFLWGSIRGVLEWKEVLECVKYTNSSSSLFKIHKEKIPLCHFWHGEIYSFPSRLPNYASYSSKDFYLNTKLVCLIPPHRYNYCFTQMQAILLSVLYKVADESLWGALPKWNGASLTVWHSL